MARHPAFARHVAHSQVHHLRQWHGNVPPAFYGVPTSSPATNAARKIAMAFSAPTVALFHDRFSSACVFLKEGSVARRLCEQATSGGNGAGGGGITGCQPGFVLVDGVCKQRHDFLPDVDEDFLSPAEASERVGQPVMGRYGAGVAPGNRVINRAVCGRSRVLGDDGVCYNKRGFRKADRMWNPGRPPLFTGGERNAVTIAKRVGRQMTNMATSLQDAGLIKKPIARKKPKKKC